MDVNARTCMCCVYAFEGLIYLASTKHRSVFPFVDVERLVNSCVRLCVSFYCLFSCAVGLPCLPPFNERFRPLLGLLSSNLLHQVLKDLLLSVVTPGCLAIGDLTLHLVSNHVLVFFRRKMEPQTEKRGQEFALCNFMVHAQQ